MLSESLPDCIHVFLVISRLDLGRSDYFILDIILFILGFYEVIFV